jgi:hypothetical protein
MADRKLGADDDDQRTLPGKAFGRVEIEVEPYPDPRDPLESELAPTSSPKPPRSQARPLPREEPDDDSNVPSIEETGPPSTRSFVGRVDIVPPSSGRGKDAAPASAGPQRFSSSDKTRVPAQARARLPEDPQEAANDPRVAAMRELYAAGDADAARFIAETIDPTPVGRISREDETKGDVSRNAGNDGRTVVGSAGALAAVLAKKGVPRLLQPKSTIADLPLDQRATLLLGYVDGKTTMQDILERCTLPEGEALQLMSQLAKLSIIAID